MILFFDGTELISLLKRTEFSFYQMMFDDLTLTCIGWHWIIYAASILNLSLSRYFFINSLFILH
jgi:hypothetical protein